MKKRSEAVIFLVFTQSTPPAFYQVLLAANNYTLLNAVFFFLHFFVCYGIAILFNLWKCLRHAQIIFAR